MHDTKYVVGADDVGARLDVWLSGHLPELSRSRIQSLIRTGHVTIGRRPVRAHRKISKGMEIEIKIPPVSSVKLVPENIPLSVLHEDSHIFVLPFLFCCFLCRR